MSLRAFHVFFISVCVLLCLGFGVWCLNSDYAHGKGGYQLIGYISFLVGAALVIYEILFLRKTGSPR